MTSKPFLPSASRSSTLTCYAGWSARPASVERPGGPCHPTPGLRDSDRSSVLRLAARRTASRSADDDRLGRPVSVSGIAVALPRHRDRGRRRAMGIRPARLSRRLSAPTDRRARLDLGASPLFFPQPPPCRAFRSVKRPHAIGSGRPAAPIGPARRRSAGGSCVDHNRAGSRHSRRSFARRDRSPARRPAAARGDRRGRRRARPCRWRR